APAPRSPRCRRRFAATRTIAVRPVAARSSRVSRAIPVVSLLSLGLSLHLSLGLSLCRHRRRLAVPAGNCALARSRPLLVGTGDLGRPLGSCDLASISRVGRVGDAHFVPPVRVVAPVAALAERGDTPAWRPLG